MGIKYEDALNLTWKEFDYYASGYWRRLERELDQTRMLMATMFNSSGFSKKRVNPKDLMQLSIDKVKIKPPTKEEIQTWVKAFKLN